jgi:hypothetical protein
MVFNLKKLNEVKAKEKYCVEVSKEFAALDYLNVEVEINRVCEMITENIKMSVKKSLDLL